MQLSEDVAAKLLPARVQAAAGQKLRPPPREQRSEKQALQGRGGERVQAPIVGEEYQQAAVECSQHHQIKGQIARVPQAGNKEANGI